MARSRLVRPLAVGLMLAVAGTAAAQPSTVLNTYVLFAQDNLRIRTATISDGDVGVNAGILYLRGTIDAPKSDFAAGVAHMDAKTVCEDLFTNDVVGGSGTCVQRTGGVPNPLFATLAQACEFPTNEVGCGGQAVTVDHGQTRTLQPGSYGDLVVQGGGAGPAVVKLEPGDYRFCNVRVSRNGSILFQGPSRVIVAGSSRISNATDVGPDPSLGLSAPPPGAIKWFVAGSQARFSRKGNVGMHVCAPNGKMVVGSGTVLTGRFVARSIRMKKADVRFAGPVPGTCGDTVKSPDEQCETADHCGGQPCIGCVCGGTTTTTLPGCTTDEECNQGSPGGTFICENGQCVPGCDDDADCNQGSPGGGFVCEEGRCVPGGSTTTTTTTTPGTTTSSPTTTTSTTLRPCTDTSECPVGVCRDGVCVPECDSDDDCQGSPDASFVCLDGRCVATSEVCGDCLDNDGDGLVDFEDADCCDGSAGQLFPMDLRKGRFRARGAGESALRLKATLARTGLSGRLQPASQQMGLQIRNQAGEVLCASLPAGSLKGKRRIFRFSSKKTPVPVEIARGLDRVAVKLTKKGLVRFRAKAKRASLATPAEGILTLTVGFTGGAENSCSQAVRLFRGGKGGQLRFP